MKKYFIGLSISVLAFMSIGFADSATVKIKQTTGQHKELGSIHFEDTKYGLLILPRLTDLPPGPHGFHVHQDPSCAMEGMAAKGHLDPMDTGKHFGPYDGKGHAGDLPVLEVDVRGSTVTPLLAPRLTVSDIKQHAIMIHAGGDNYSDSPEKLGGGGARIACGVVQ